MAISRNTIVEIVTITLLSAMQVYFTGESFRNVKRFLKLQGVKMSHVAVYKWILKRVDNHY
jgi:transposase-like protein